jgi:phosphoribosylformylglycinamidine synthase
MAIPKVCVLRTAGTNCDQETAWAFSRAGARTELVHINLILQGRQMLDTYHIIALPGGFTYGDDIAAGKILANELRFKLIDQLRAFIAKGKLIIGICNGFQILVKAGLLPGNDEFKQEVTLSLNDSAQFEDRWVYLKHCNQGNKKGRCVWTHGLPERIYLPVAHGEGKFMVAQGSVMKRLKSNGQIVFQYCNAKGEYSGYPDNPNGSEEHIAGICDETGRIMGLMPHPERHACFSQHPRWTERASHKEGDGQQIFRNGVAYARTHL